MEEKMPIPQRTNAQPSSSTPTNAPAPKAMTPPALQLQAGEGAMQTDAPIQATLDPDQTAAAKQWAADSNIGEEAIDQLQTALGISTTGVYDDATINAVYNRQVANNEGKSDNKKGVENGIADEAFFKKQGLILTEKITNANAKAMPDFVKQFLNDDGTPKEAFANGITVGIYTHYDDQKENNQTFKKVSEPGHFCPRNGLWDRY